MIHQVGYPRQKNRWLRCITQVFRSKSIYVPGSKLPILGMVIPPLVGNPYNGYINPYYWADFPIPYFMEIMGVDRPDHTYENLKRLLTYLEFQ